MQTNVTITKYASSTDETVYLTLQMLQVEIRVLKVDTDQHIILPVV